MRIKKWHLVFILFVALVAGGLIGSIFDKRIKHCFVFAYQKTHHALFQDDSIYKSYGAEGFITSIYQLMKDTHDILDDYDVHYWVDGGTLLGAIRHGGFIPWDDDLDISVPLEEEPRLMEALKEFEKLGYYVIDDGCTYKVFTIKPSRWHGESPLPPSLDIFIVHKKTNGKVGYYRMMAKHHFGYEFNAKDVENRQLYKFGDVDVYGPINPEPFLDITYPKGWRDRAYHTTGDHMTGEERTKNIDLGVNAFEPARPFGPLKQNYISHVKKK